MKTKDPKLIAVRFNECINRQDLEGLSLLMTDDHAFIDRERNVRQPKQVMVQAWREFFGMFPNYKNTFQRIESKDNLVTILGSAYWSQDKRNDPAIWTATIVNNLVQEWRVYFDTEANRRRFNLS
jgi:ketosteroid isomerase-like protein